MILSPHFTIEELTHSDVALRKGLDNTPNAGECDNLARLCDTLLEPARALVGPLRVNSGYRCPAVNQAVGGATGSAHMDGRAADVVPANIHDAFDLLRSSTLPFDQLIFECGSWLHMAIAREGEEPRREVLTATGTPGKWAYRRLT